CIFFWLSCAFGLLWTKRLNAQPVARWRNGKVIPIVRSVRNDAALSIWENGPKRNIGFRDVPRQYPNNQKSTKINLKDLAIVAGASMSNSIQRLNIKSKVRANAVAVFLISICFLGLLTMAGCGGNNQETANSVPDYVIPTTDGQKIQLSQYRGKVVVVDFWAPWCGPCRAETPHLVKIANDYKDKGVVVIGLSIPDPRTQDGQVEQFVKDFKINYTIGFAPDGMFEKFDSVGDGPIPQTLVFGRDGRKILQTAGFDPMQDGEKLQRAVQQAVSGQPARS